MGFVKQIPQRVRNCSSAVSEHFFLQIFPHFQINLKQKMQYVCASKITYFYQCVEGGRLYVF